MSLRRSALHSSMPSNLSYSSMFPTAQRNSTIADFKNVTMKESQPIKLTILHNGFDETMEENTCLNDEFSDLFSQSGISEDGFTNATKECLRKFSVIKSEDLLDFDPNTLQMNLMQKKREEMVAERTERRLKKAYNETFKKVNKLNGKEETLLAAVNDLEYFLQEEKKMKENDSASQVYAEKQMLEYERKVEHITNDLRNIHADDISQSEILRKSEVLAEKKAELYELNKEIDFFTDLPPNLLRAKGALEQKNEEYKKIKTQLDKKMCF